MTIQSFVFLFILTVSLFATVFVLWAKWKLLYTMLSHSAENIPNMNACKPVGNSTRLCPVQTWRTECQTDTLKNNLNMQQCRPERVKHILTSAALHGSPYEPSLLVSCFEKNWVDSFVFLYLSLYEVHYSCVENKTILNVQMIKKNEKNKSLEMVQILAN